MKTLQDVKNEVENAVAQNKSEIVSLEDRLTGLKNGLIFLEGKMKLVLELMEQEANAVVKKLESSVEDSATPTTEGTTNVTSQNI